VLWGFSRWAPCGQRSLAGWERVMFGRCDSCVVQHHPLVTWGGHGKGVVAVPGDVGGWRMYRRCNRILHFIRIYPFIFVSGLRLK
jgi:hypothetical protein